MCATGGGLQAQPVKVSLELVLAVDVSASVDSNEYRLQMEGISQAFHHPSVVSAIERLGGNGIAVAVILWSQAYNIKLALPFVHVHDRQSSLAFGSLVANVSRGSLSGYTALGGAIGRATQLLEQNQFDGARRVIDVSGDGRNNTRPALGGPRQQAKKLGITVNGLAIQSDDAKLTRYYFENVIVGAGAFVETAADYTDFAIAMLRKLVREITPPITELGPPHPIGHGYACASCIRPVDQATIME